MSKQNSKGCSNSPLHPFVILQHGLEVKRSIQNEVFEIIEILKRREYDLCLEVDQLCLDLLCEAEMLEKLDAPVLNDPSHEVDKSIQYIKNRDLLTSKLKFNGDLKFYRRALKNYGEIQKIDCRKNNMCKPKTNDKLSEMMEKLWTGDQLETSASSETANSMLNFKRPSFSSLARPLCTVRMQNKNEWLANGVQENPEIPTDGKIQAPSCNMLSEISYTPALSGSCPGSPAEVAAGDNPQNSIKACFGAYLKPSNLYLWLNPNQTNHDNPENTIKASFDAYLKPDDLNLWLNPSRSSDKSDPASFEEWVAKDTRPSLSEGEDVIDEPCRIITEEVLKSFLIIEPRNEEF